MKHRTKSAKSRNSRQEDGSILLAAVVLSSFLIVSAYILITRSFFFFTGALKSSDYKTAQAAAEFGASELISKLNNDENGYLLVTQPACWQSSLINSEGLYGASFGSDKIEGVRNNTTESLQWRVIPLVRGQSQTAALQSGNYTRYQLAEYIPPERLLNNTSLGFDQTCPAEHASTNPDIAFGNRFGGNAYLKVNAELYRNGTLAAQHSITQEIHVTGLAASSLGETSMVLMRAADLNTILPWLDKEQDTDGDGIPDEPKNGVKDDNEPWIDIHCVFCIKTTQPDLKTEVGMQGTLYNNYDGTIITGSFAFPKFRFQDDPPAGATEGDGVLGTGETVLHTTLRTALQAKSNPIDLNNPPLLSDPSTTYPYKSDSFVDSNLVDECAVATDNVTEPNSPYDYIGCVVDSIDLCSDSGQCSNTTSAGKGRKKKNGEDFDPDANTTRQILVRTDQTSNRPVYIFVQHEGSDYDAILLSGQDSIKNADPDKPLSLGLFGLPPTVSSPAPEPSCNQTLRMAGTESLTGIWTWFPRGSMDFGGGTVNLSGILWICDFDGRGNLSFDGSLQDTSSGCGVNTPCGIYKYRAKGIAQVEREQT